VLHRTAEALVSNPIRHAIRSLAKTPGFTTSALVILTLGIGANTAIFSVVNAVLLRPVPYPEPDSIVTVFHVPPSQAFPGIPIFPASPANYLDWRNQSKSFEAMAAMGFETYRLGGGSRPQSVLATSTEPEFFSVLRVKPLFGRAFTPAECQPGRDGVIMLSHVFAQTHFGEARSAVGKRLDLDGRTFEVIGVMAPDFQLKSWFPASTDGLVPLVWTPEERATRGNHNRLVIGRLRHGVSAQEAQSEMNIISERLARAYPEENTGWGAVVSTLTDHLVGDVRPSLLVLLGAVGFVLLIACANTANLVLARTIARRKELAIRLAIGASAAQTIRPVLLETTLLALAGGAIGLLFARYGQSLVLGALADQLPPATQVRVDTLVLGATLVASIGTGLAAGLIGSWRLMRLDPNEALKQGRKTDSQSSRSRTRTALVIAEVSLSLVLLVGAGLMIRSFWALRAVDPGFNAEDVTTMTVPTPVRPGADQRSRLYDELLPQVQSIPGVAAAAGIDVLPLAGGGSQQPIVVEGRPAEIFALQPTVSVRRSTPGYLRAMQIPLRAGREFTPEDTTGSKAVVIVSESMARKYWPGENPLGKRLRISFTPEIVREVVGVAGDVKENGLNVLEPVAMLYEPVLQTDRFELSLVVRTDRNAPGLVPEVTRILQRINAELPVRDVRSLHELLATSLSRHRFGMFLFGALAALALLLAAVGIFSVLAYNLRTRVPEIGIRMALGAGVFDVVRLVVIEGMRPTLIGIALGAAGAYALSGILSRLIFGVSSTDGWTFAAVAALLAGVALLACVIPGYRAAGVDPASALRND
jgi:predicted permease